MSQSNSRGRPKDKSREQAVKKALIDAARRAIESKSYKSITVRALTDEANVNSAMLRYHFGNKEGLFAELLSQLIAPPLTGLATQLESLPEKEQLHRIVAMYQSLLHKTPWLPRLLLEEMLPESSQLRERFLQGQIQMAKWLIRGAIERWQQSGYFRQDMSSQHILVSLIGTILWPYLARSMTREMADFDVVNEEPQAWQQHLIQLIEAQFSPAQALSLPETQS